MNMLRSAFVTTFTFLLNTIFQLHLVPILAASPKSLYGKIEDLKISTKTVILARQFWCMLLIPELRR